MNERERHHTVRIRDVFAFAWSYWRQRPLMIALVTSLMLAATLCDIFIPKMAGRMVDAVAGPGAADPARRDEALHWLMAMVGLGAGFYGLRQLAFRLWARLASGCMRQIALDAYRRVQRFSTDWHANAFSGATVRKIGRGMWSFDLFGDTLYVGLMPTAVVLLGVTTLLLLNWPELGLFAATAVVLYATVAILLATRYVAPARREAIRRDTALGARLADTIGCNALVKAFGAESREDEGMEAETEHWRSKTVRAWLRTENQGAVQSLMMLCFQGGLLGITLWLWSQGRATAGQVAFALTSYFLIHGYLRDIGMQVRNLQQAMSDMEDVVAFAASRPDIVDRPGARRLAGGLGRIRFEGVGFGYANQGARIYQDFTLEIAPGETVGLVGHSGSGKSTFVKLLQRLYDLDEGRILIDGQDIAGVTQESLRQAISLVPQDPVLFHRTLAENIAYGRPGATMDDIRQAAILARADEFIARLPLGYDTLVGERGVKLSGGERQRVAIARAILADTPILVMDEATSSLDSVSEAAIQEGLENLMRGRTTIIVAHRLATVKDADRILVFDRGRIVEQGSHADLVGRAEGRYRRLYEMQALGLAA